MSAPVHKGIPVQDAIETVKAYARQEIVQPLQGTARWAAPALAGAFLLGLGLLLLDVALLRGLQHAFHGNVSFVPYIICMVAMMVQVVVAYLFSRRTGLPARGEVR
jgi:hypothetical protein